MKCVSAPRTETPPALLVRRRPRWRSRRVSAAVIDKRFSPAACCGTLFQPCRQRTEYHASARHAHAFASPRRAAFNACSSAAPGTRQHRLSAAVKRGYMSRRRQQKKNTGTEENNG